MTNITREQARDMAEAHAEGMHANLPREDCPECEDRPLRTYPPADNGVVRRYRATSNPHVVEIGVSAVREAWAAADEQRAKFEDGKARGLTGAPLRRLYDKWQRLSEEAAQLEVTP